MGWPWQGWPILFLSNTIPPPRTSVDSRRCPLLDAFEPDGLSVLSVKDFDPVAVENCDHRSISKSLRECCRRKEVKTSDGSFKLPYKRAAHDSAVSTRCRSSGAGLCNFRGKFGRGH